jgi:hypothetical protein
MMLVLAASAPTVAEAAYSEPCAARVTYEGTYNQHRHRYRRHFPRWTPVFPATCTYITGRELNEAVGVDGYDSRRTYTIVDYAGGRTLVRLIEPLSCGFVAEAPCAERISRRLSGRDDFWRRWVICQPSLGRRCAID